MNVLKLTNDIAELPGSDLIIRAAAFQDSRSEPISPDFEFIDDVKDASMAWFDSDSEAAAQFVPFGQSSDRGLFAYWKCDTCYPIVYLASECVGSRVIAESTKDLLSIIAHGSNDYAIDIAYTDPSHGEEWEPPADDSEAFTDFRRWLKSELGILQAASPLVMIKHAMAASPDLMKWIREWQDQRYEA